MDFAPSAFSGDDSINCATARARTASALDRASVACCNLPIEYAVEEIFTNVKANFSSLSTDFRSGPAREKDGIEVTVYRISSGDEIDVGRRECVKRQSYSDGT